MPTQPVIEHKTMRLITHTHYCCQTKRDRRSPATYLERLLSPTTCLPPLCYHSTHPNLTAMNLNSKCSCSLQLAHVPFAKEGPLKGALTFHVAVAPPGPSGASQAVSQQLQLWSSVVGLSNEFCMTYNEIKKRQSATSQS
jgi:hypothetical protein